MLEEKARKVRALILDVDGVLTDGSIIYCNSGKELKVFNVQDGFGMSLLERAGIKSIIITAKKSRALIKRAKEMKVAKVYQNAIDKVRAYDQVLKNFKLSDEEVCYIGDDLIDLPILRRAGLAVVVSDGVDELKAIAHYVTEKEGGRGAVREVIDIILKAKGQWNEVTRGYFSQDRSIFSPAE